jgi:SAM-dependent methyltransferase
MHQYLRLLIVSASMLFWELILIRWLSASIRVIAYYTNFVLVAAFFGLGAGALLARFRLRMHRFVFPAVSFCVLLGVVLSGFHHRNPGGGELFTWLGRPSIVLSSDADTLGKTEAPLWLLLGLPYVATALVFLVFGQWIGNLFKNRPPLTAYSVEIFGSIVGILLFALMSQLHLGPLSWFAVGFLLLFLALDRSVKDHALALVCVAVVFAVATPVAGKFLWSPYYKIRFEPLQKISGGPDAEIVDFGRSIGYALTVNNDYHQMILDLGAGALEHPFQRDWGTLYNAPYSLFDDLPDGPILVVGSGTGNDVSAALRNTARTVHAVDIDPAIIELGRLHHFERPYQSERVVVTATDARSFFQTTDERFALVVFGFLDSHTLLSSFSSVRLDNFVYTRESFEQVKRILLPGGAVILTFATGTQWLHERLLTMLDDVFDLPVRVLAPPSRYTYGTVYATRKAAEGSDLAPGRPPDRQIRVPSDDWPFFYLRRPTIPAHYRLFIAIVVVLGFVPLLALPRGQRRIRLPYFLLGAGFFLLETSNIVTLAILFGSTWWVNILVFLGILVLVLLGNLTSAALGQPRLGVFFSLLLASVVVAYVIHPSSLLALKSAIGRNLLAVLVFLGPVYFASVIFASLIKNEPNLYQAYGSNVLGAVVGGACEYTSMLLGFKFLLLVTFGFYAAALVLLLAGRRAAPSPAPTG